MPGNEVTIEDLVSDPGGSGGSGGGSGGNGEWISDIIERLDDKGLLEPLIFGAPEDGNITAAEPTDTDTDNMDEMDAQTVKELLLKVYDNSHMIPGLSEDPTLSEMIKLLEEREDAATQLIGQYL